MEDRTRYVYKIFDKLNKSNIYIGTTFDIETRWVQHKNESNSKKLKDDMLEYGTQDFDIEILFEGTEEEAYRKEIELIKELKPYYNNGNDKGGKLAGDNIGESHKDSKLTKKDVINICNRVVINNESVTDVSKDYPYITRQELYEIVNGKAWKSVIEAPRKLSGEVNINGEKHGNAKLTDKDAYNLCIRIVENNEDITEVMKDYPSITKETIYGIVNGTHWKHIKATKREPKKKLIKEEVLHIRKLSYEGLSTREILDNHYSGKTIGTIRNTVTGKTNYKYGGPIKGEDY